MKKRTTSLTRALWMAWATAFPYLSAAQFTYEVDLAKDRDGTTELSIEPMSAIRIVITNRIPGMDYDISVVKSTLEIDPYPADALTVNAQFAPGDPCASIATARNAVGAVSKEAEVPAAVKAFEAVCTANPNRCSAEKIANLREEVNESITYVIPIEYGIKAGQRLTIKVARKEGDKTYTWTHMLSTQARGNWFLTYGFSFVTDAIDPDEPYFAKQQDTTFVVTQKSGAKGPAFIPSIMAHWVPAKWAQWSYVPSLSGGLGFDLEKPTVFLGFSVVYNTNLGLHMGIAAHQQDRLRGQYAPGDVLKEALAEDQLNEKVYGVDPFISLSFRFGSDPFKRNKETAADGASIAN